MQIEQNSSQGGISNKRKTKSTFNLFSASWNKLRNIPDASSYKLECSFGMQCKSGVVVPSSGVSLCLKKATSVVPDLSPPIAPDSL